MMHISYVLLKQVPDLKLKDWMTGKSAEAKYLIHILQQVHNNVFSYRMN
jgi:hypothetical protein